jgi:hypothetical protein
VDVSGTPLEDHKERLRMIFSAAVAGHKEQCGSALAFAELSLLADGRIAARTMRFTAGGLSELASQPSDTAPDGSPSCQRPVSVGEVDFRFVLMAQSSSSSGSYWSNALASLCCSRWLAPYSLPGQSLAGKASTDPASGLAC